MQIKLKPVGTYTSHTKLSEHTLHTQSCRNIHFTHKAVPTYTSHTKLSEHTLNPQSCRNIHFTHKAVRTYTTHKAVGTYTSHTKLSEHTPPTKLSEHTPPTKLSEHTLHTQSCRNIHFTHKAVGTYTTYKAVGTYTHLERQIHQRIYEFLGWLYFSFPTICLQCVEQNDIYIALVRNIRENNLKTLGPKVLEQRYSLPLCSCAVCNLDYVF
jgi:hypothetical protein